LIFSRIQKKMERASNRMPFLYYATFSKVFHLLKANSQSADSQAYLPSRAFILTRKKVSPAPKIALPTDTITVWAKSSGTTCALTAMLIPAAARAAKITVVWVILFWVFILILLLFIYILICM
jgi:hypothetical protein